MIAEPPPGLCDCRTAVGPGGGLVTAAGAAGPAQNLKLLQISPRVVFPAAQRQMEFGESPSPAAYPVDRCSR